MKGKIKMDSIKGLMKNIPVVSKFQAEDGMNLKTVQKKLEEKMNEKVKIYGFIGMEVYDLIKEKKIKITEIKAYVDKMDALNNEVKELEKAKEELERKNTKKNICVCGYKLKPHDRFCPNCGAEIARDTIVCTCGAELAKDVKFCSVCGKSMEDIINFRSDIKETAMKECICGAKVPAGQFMCLECGRKIED